MRDHPLQVTGDDIRIYKEALRRGGLKKSTFARKLSVLRGAFEQFAELIETELRNDDIEEIPNTLQKHANT